MKNDKQNWNYNFVMHTVQFYPFPDADIFTVSHLVISSPFRLTFIMLYLYIQCIHTSVYTFTLGNTLSRASG